MRRSLPAEERRRRNAQNFDSKLVGGGLAVNTLLWELAAEKLGCHWLTRSGSSVMREVTSRNILLRQVLPLDLSPVFHPIRIIQNFWFHSTTPTCNAAPRVFDMYCHCRGPRPRVLGAYLARPFLRWYFTVFTQKVCLVGSHLFTWLRHGQIINSKKGLKTLAFQPGEDR